jgi:hypothetical protein
MGGPDERLPERASQVPRRMRLNANPAAAPIAASLQSKPLFGAVTRKITARSLAACS